MVELTREDWTRLATLLHGYGSVGALEEAVAPQPSSATNRVDLADMVRVEVAHQLGGSRTGGEPQQEPEPVLPGSPTPNPLARHLHVLRPASGVAWVSLALILIGGVAPLPAAATGVLAVLGFQIGLRRDGRIGWWLWRATAAACVVTWAVASSWPFEASALVLGSVLAGCIEPLGSKFVHTRAQ
jgi:hypothetical protein